MNAQPAILELNQVTKVFLDFWRRPQVAAVQDVSLEVKRGEIFGLLGPNGSGKSTTIKMILGLLFPSRGRIRVLGESPRHVQVKRRIGYLPEESYLYPYLTSEETLDFYGRLFDLETKERRQRIEQLLEMIGLQHTRRRAVGTFSKGMARRIGLAQALINDPDLIILDEPTSGLDPLGCRQVKDLILMLARRGKTILMTSHLLADVEDVCDRVAILYNGRVQALGAMDTLLEETTRYRMTLPVSTTRGHVDTLASHAHDLTGEAPLVDHPRRDLEQFFLDVVDKARRESTEASGVGQDQGPARYLAGPDSEPPPSPAGSAEERKQAIRQALNELLPPDRKP
ncbi:MAG TPA: ABC transporter ATP-binding protein [Kiritimatiellia bacterium]|nr:ABC transporter ATP-binding protein [Kiritimatiellia bacterium]HMO97908.1 ABC transporter ATP-binding protein [Kiritimatiellia bacterium]HMP95573.1 ABC transporter ATP-binding protein [Kiritimatiellia bacterium]